MLRQLLICTPNHRSARRQCQPRHDGSHDQIRPIASGTEHASCGQHHRDIANRIVTAAQPDRTHVGISIAKGVKHQGDSTISEQCQHRDGAHGYGFGRDAVDCGPSRLLRTNKPNAAIVRPFTIAARDRHASTMDSTANVIP